jgi:hypothetical protein
VRARILNQVHCRISAKLKAPINLRYDLTSGHLIESSYRNNCDRPLLTAGSKHEASPNLAGRLSLQKPILAHNSLSPQAWGLTASAGGY